MDISLFDYELPNHLIAQFPTRRRGDSRLMVVHRDDGRIEHRSFRDIAEYLRPGDGLVVNNTKVFKARLWGHRASGAKVEVFLIRPAGSGGEERWEALVSPSRRVKAGEHIFFSQTTSVQLLREFGAGKWEVIFRSKAARQRIISQFGHVPLPHYISRADQPDDIRRYQTVFADSRRVGAVAAPTAGFHFSSRVLEKLAAKGITEIQITLHVGPGTFKPVKVQQVEDHTVDPEFAELTVESAAAINNVKTRDGAIFAVGTTSVRTLESACMTNGRVAPFAHPVDLFIRPGFEFRVVDHLITNFHLPKSSLLLLVSAFAGRDLIMKAYHEAIEREYRFYSYGDAMLIL